MILWILVRLRGLLDTLAGIGETVLIYPSTGGRPKARRMLTQTTPEQEHLIDVFDLRRWAPRSWVIHQPGPNTHTDQRKGEHGQR